MKLPLKVKIPPDLLLDETAANHGDGSTTSRSSTDKVASIEGEEEQPRKKLGVSAVFANRAMTKTTLILWVNWTVVTLGYYGISLGIGDVGPNLFINFMLVSLVEIPSYLFAYATIDHLGRKTVYVLCILLTGLGCLSAAFLEDDSAVKTTLSLIGSPQLRSW